MTDDDQRIIGGLVARMDGFMETTAQWRKEQRDDLAKLFAKIDSISLDGCAIGQQHERDVSEIKLRLHELEDRPSRLVGLGAVILTIAGLVGTFLIWLHDRLMK